MRCLLQQAAASASDSLQAVLGSSPGDASAKSSFDAASLQQQSSVGAASASGGASDWLEVEADPFECANEVV